MASAADIFNEIKNSPTAPWNVLHALATAPQQPFEPGWLHAMRTVNIPVPPVVQQIPSAASQVFAAPLPQALAPTPVAPVAQPKASDVFAKSYADPSYSTAEANAAKITGVPAELLARVRLLGEKSNADQVNPKTGASTPYQITASTRGLIMKKYGIDPWANPTNAALGAAYVLHEQAGNPGPKDWNPQLAARAVGGYFGGAAGAANPFGSASDGSLTTGQYVQRVLGPDTKLDFPALNPYDPRYDKAAMGEIDKEQAALMTPSHFSVAGPGPAPALPTPEALPTTDFTQADEALNRMRPVPMSAKDQMAIQRNDFFKGIAQAMMNTTGNEGLGTFFLKLGAGALAGKAAAGDELRKEQSEFDDKMARYQAAVYQNDIAKAQTIHNEATAQVNQNNQFARDRWTLAYDQWKGAGGTVNISGTDAVIQRKDANGNLTVDVLPIAGAVNAAMAQQRAQLFSSMGGRQFAGNQQVSSMQNAITARAAINEMSGGASKTSDAAATAAPAMYGTFLATHGGVADVLGPDGAASLEKSVQAQLAQAQLVPGSKEYADRHDTLVATELTKLGIADPKIMQKMIAAGSAMPSIMTADALNSARTRTATDAKGQTTTSTTQPAAADMFNSDQFNQDLTDHGYSRY